MVNIDKIKSLIKEKGLKVQSVFEKMGSSRYKLYDWERGKSCPSESELETLAELLGTSAAYLKDETDIKTAQKNKPAENGEPINEKQMLIMEKLKMLTPENYELAIAQLDAILNHQDKQGK